MFAVSVMAAMIGFGPAALAQSTVIFDNLPDANDMSDRPIDYYNTAYAQAFTTDAGSWTFESVTFALTAASALAGNGNPCSGLYSCPAAFDLAWLEADTSGSVYGWNSTSGGPVGFGRALAAALSPPQVI